MIIGIGTDLIEIQRVKKACEKKAFLTRCFTKNEIDFFKENFTKAADNFAVKEAVSKIFGTGISGFALKDIEVLRDDKGKPYVNLYNGAKQKAVTLGIDVIHVSITNTDKLSQAFVIGEKI